MSERGAATTEAPTGIVGLDLALGGGLRLGRTTLLVGTPGWGKTVMSLPLRAERERAEAAAVIEGRQPEQRDRLKPMAAEADQAARLLELERELAGTRARLQQHHEDSAARCDQSEVAPSARLETRGADPVGPAQRGSGRTAAFLPDDVAFAPTIEETPHGCRRIR